MCSRFNLVVEQSRLERYLGFEFGFELVTSPNIAPTEPVLGVVTEGGVRAARIFRWGLEPSWAVAPGRGPLINVRSETAPERFRSTFAKRRCLIPATGFFEWQTLPQASGKPIKQPYNFHLPDGGPFTMAGLWERRKLADGGFSESCSVITCEPNEVVSPFHDRMPAILDRDDWDLWLSGEEAPATLQPLLRPYPAADLIATQVSRALSNPRLKDPTTLQPETQGRLDMD